MKRCLLVIDMQMGIFGLKQPVWDGECLIRNVKEAVRQAQGCGFKVIISCHENGTFLKKGTEGHGIIAGIEAPGDAIIAKRRPDVFEGTGLDEMLKKEGIGGVIIAGLISNGCVRDACLSALRRGYDTTLLGDGHSTFYKGSQSVISRINSEMEAAGARVIRVDELGVLR